MTSYQTPTEGFITCRTDCLSSTLSGMENALRVSLTLKKIFLIWIPNIRKHISKELESLEKRLCEYPIIHPEENILQVVWKSNESFEDIYHVLESANCCSQLKPIRCSLY